MEDFACPKRLNPAKLACKSDEGKNVWVSEARQVGSLELACSSGSLLCRVCVTLAQTSERTAGMASLPFLFRFLPALLLLLLGHVAMGAKPEVDYASLRADVVEAYAQQAAEMAQSLSVMQSLSAETAATLSRLESACS